MFSKSKAAPREFEWWNFSQDPPPTSSLLHMYRWLIKMFKNPKKSRKFWIFEEEKNWTLWLQSKRIISWIYIILSHQKNGEPLGLDDRERGWPLPDLRPRRKRWIDTRSKQYLSGQKRAIKINLKWPINLSIDQCNFTFILSYVIHSST